MSAPQSPSGPRLLIPSLLFIAMVVAAVGSLGAPLITSVATTFHVSLGNAQWALTISLLSGAICFRPMACTRRRHWSASPRWRSQR